MKMKSILFKFLLLVFILITYVGCDFAVSIETRVEMFVTDLNTDRDNVYLNFLPDDPSDYDVIKGPTVWNTSFPVGDGTPYSYSTGDLNTTYPDDVTLVLYGPSEFLIKSKFCCKFHPPVNQLAT
jgi:hypothetical protein